MAGLLVRYSCSGLRGPCRAESVPFHLGSAQLGPTPRVTSLSRLIQFRRVPSNLELVTNIQQHTHTYTVPSDIKNYTVTHGEKAVLMPDGCRPATLCQGGCDVHLTHHPDLILNPIAPSPRRVTLSHPPFPSATGRCPSVSSGQGLSGDAN